MKSKKIGKYVWTIENLSIGEGEEGVYRNPEATPGEGLLYTWDAAMRLCPNGWHLPTNEEWDDWEWNTSPKQREAFAGVLAGFRYTVGTFSTRGMLTFFWTAGDAGASAWYRSLNSCYAPVYRDSSDKAFGFSVRCVKDIESDGE